MFVSAETFERIRRHSPVLFQNSSVCYVKVVMDQPETVFFYK